MYAIIHETPYAWKDEKIKKPLKNQGFFSHLLDYQIHSLPSIRFQNQDMLYTLYMGELYYLQPLHAPDALHMLLMLLRL